MVEGQLKFLHNENQSTIEIQTDTSENPPNSDGGRDGRCEPDSALGYGQDYRSQRRAKSVEWKADQPAIGYLK